MSTLLPPCSTEALADAFSRLDSMTRDRGETWDLSPNDKHAIALVLAQARGTLTLAAPLAPEIVAILRALDRLNTTEPDVFAEHDGDEKNWPAIERLYGACRAWFAANRPGLPPEKE